MQSRKMMKLGILVLAAVSGAPAASLGRNIPNPNDRPKMARFVVNQASWTSFAYISKDLEGNSLPGNAVFAMADGRLGCGAGIPYFYVTKRHPSVVELLDGNSQGAVTFTLEQTSICVDNDWDPQDPRCAHVVMYGKFREIPESDPEYEVAHEALFNRHPAFFNYPASHKFFCAKLEIRKISVFSTFDGPVDIDVKEYFDVKC